MRIVCPHCAAAYDVPAARLSGRASLRCAACGQSWAPEGLVPAAPVLAESEPEPVEDEPAAVVETIPAPVVVAAPPANRALRAAWMASVAMVAVVVTVLLLEHRPIGQAWPPIQRLYAAIGLA